MWTVIADSSILDQEPNVLIDGLHPQTWYTMQVTADSEAGASEAEYSILTPTFRDKSEFWLLLHQMLMLPAFCSPERRAIQSLNWMTLPHRST